MRDSSNNVRTIYVTALNGNLTYNGKDVPVYGQTPFRTTPQNYVVISAISETAANTNHNFGNEVEVVIDIFSEQYRIYDNEVVDNIAGQILNILIPDPGVNGFSDTYFEVFPMARISSSYLPLQNGDNFVARKLITISNLVNEK
jgi:hypothetical protein